MVKSTISDDNVLRFEVFFKLQTPPFKLSEDWRIGGGSPCWAVPRYRAWWRSRLPAPSRPAVPPAPASVPPSDADPRSAARADSPSPWRSARYAPWPAAQNVAHGPRLAPASYTSPSTWNKRAGGIYHSYLYFTFHLKQESRRCLAQLGFYI